MGSDRQPPLIISGMHRSGTSLLTRVLERCGLFVGWRQQPRHHEAKFFQRLNDWLLLEAGGSWEHPGPMQDLLKSKHFREPAVEFLRFNLRTARTLSYLGPPHWQQLGKLDRGLPEPWGWKDPRTTLTLPIWLDVFPDARVLHIQRHGIDVAASLQVRNERLLGVLAEQFDNRRWRYHVIAPRRPHTAGFRLSEIDRGIELWEHYEAAAQQHLAAVSDRTLTIRYEDILQEPDRLLATIADFYPLRADIRDAVDDFDASRAFAYRSSPELVEAASRHAGRLQRFGY